MAKAQSGEATGSLSRVVTLKRRPEFQRVCKGARCAVAALVLEGRTREEQSGVAQARFGFTITRQVGNAVVRNRIRRRLKAAIAGIAQAHARSDFDYVVIARRPALGAPFAQLVADLVHALDRVHRLAAPRGSAQTGKIRVG